MLPDSPTPDAPQWVLDQALDLINEVRSEHGMVPRTRPYGHEAFRALCIAIEQKAALQAEFDRYKQDVSDAVNKVRDCWGHSAWPSGYACKYLDCFRLDRPKPDPLMEALLEISGEGGYDNFDHYAYRLRSALEARGLELREIEE